MSETEKNLAQIRYNICHFEEIAKQQEEQRLIEKKRLKHKRYYSKHKEELSLKRKDYYLNNKEKIKLRANNYYQEHKEEVLKKRKDYYLKNKLAKEMMKSE